MCLARYESNFRELSSRRTIPSPVQKLTRLRDAYLDDVYILKERLTKLTNTAFTLAHGTGREHELSRMLEKTNRRERKEGWPRLKREIFQPIEPLIKLRNVRVHHNKLENQELRDLRMQELFTSPAWLKLCKTGEQTLERSLSRFYSKRYACAKTRLAEVAAINASRFVEVSDRVCGPVLRATSL